MGKHVEKISKGLEGRKSEDHLPQLILDCILSNCKSEIMNMHDLQVNKRSAQRNSNFQKLFSLPVEEFLINDFACAIKRKIPIQVRFKLSILYHN